MPPSFDDAFRQTLRELFVWRRDVRCFRTDPLAAGTVERLLEIACLSPSVGLSQPWRFVMVDEPARRHAVRENFAACNQAALAGYEGERAARYARLKLAGLDEAPCHLAAFADAATTQGHGLGRRTMPEMVEFSVAMAIHALWLAARAEGIGLGWVSILEPVAVRETLDLPVEWRLIGYLCLGYPRDDDDVPALERSEWERRRPGASFLLRR